MAGARRRSRTALAALVLIAAVLVPCLVAGAAERPAPVDPSLFRELRWRPIGPFRGGRTKAATGVRGRPGLFYIGVVNGGVWKTTDYGRTWKPIFDDQPTGSIGAIAVAPSNPDVIYVGSGEGMQRPDLSTGDGIYKSTDGGKTLAPPGPARRPADPADRRGPARREAPVRGRARPPLRAERRARHLPLDGRRRELREGAVPRREHGRRRRRPRSDRRRTWSTRCCGRRARAPGRTAPSAGRAAGSTSRRTAGGRWRQLETGLPTFAEGLGRIGITVAPSEPRRLYATVEARSAGGHLPLRRRGRELAPRQRRPARGGAARATWPRYGRTRRIPTSSSSRRS